MRRRTTALVGVITLGIIAPVSVVSAQTPDNGEPDKADLEEAVTESTTGSYIVVMRDDPLVADIAQDDLDTPAADTARDALEAEQDEVLAEAGIDSGEKVQEYTNALNGFSALLSHDEAMRLAAHKLPIKCKFVTREGSLFEG